MEKLVCKYCGGNRFAEEDDAYVCKYCHTRYDKSELPSAILPNKKALWRQKKFWSVLILALLLLSIGLIGLIGSQPKTSSTKKVPMTSATISSSSSSLETASESSTSSSSSYSEYELSNPTRNVLTAEFSLDPSDIKLAKASVAKYGGSQKADFEQRLAAAQKQSEQVIKTLPTQAQHPQQLVQNPQAEFSRFYYYREGGFFEAGIPDFTQYTAADIIKMWGQPDEILTDDAKITKNLGVEWKSDDPKSKDYSVPANLETQILYQHCYNNGKHGDGSLTWRETRAAIAWLNDAAYGTYSKALIYSKQGKPDLYFDEKGKIYYVSPLMNYLAIPRLPNNFHPYEGLGKYPDDFPDNYPKPNTWSFTGEAPK